MRLFFSVGEPSGDLHGANLIRQLRRIDPQYQCVGYGGPRMRDAGCQLHFDLTQLAVMWFLRVLFKLPQFLRLLWQADRYFRAHRPDAVILIDYPGFNWWIARRAKARGIPVFYYGSPQLWAWAEWRVAKMRRYVDHLLCKLPFEVPWYEQHQCRATYVGHPYFDQLAEQSLDAAFERELAQDTHPLLTLLPGSRDQEVRSNLPILVRAAQRVGDQVPGLRLAIASFNTRQAEMAANIVNDSAAKIEVFVGKTAELIKGAECCLACSGSVSLELLYYQKPSVIVYRVHWMAKRIEGYFRRVRYISLVNLLATDRRFTSRGELYDARSADAREVPFPEYLTSGDCSAQVAEHAIRWLRDPLERQRVVAQLSQLRQLWGKPGASRRAAEHIDRLLRAANLGMRASA